MLVMEALNGMTLLETLQDEMSDGDFLDDYLLENKDEERKGASGENEGPAAQATETKTIPR